MKTILERLGIPSLSKDDAPIISARDKTILEAYTAEGWKLLEKQWIYKTYAHQGEREIDIVHLCRDIGFCSIGYGWKCTACGDDVPFALKMMRIKY